MGLGRAKEKSVKLVIDGLDEFDVRLDDLESKFEDMLVLITALSKEIGDLKSAKKAPAKKAPAKKAPVKKPAKRKAVK
jgi:fumarate hydratase class II